MSEARDVPISADTVSSSLREKVSMVVSYVNQQIAPLGITTDGEPPLHVKDEGGNAYATVTNTIRAAENGGFRFWAKLYANYLPTFSQETAIINDIVMPRKGEGLGSQFLAAWEDGMKSVGVTHFAATNIRNLDAMRFWEKHGYTPFGTIHNDGTPYAMIKGNSTI